MAQIRKIIHIVAGGPKELIPLIGTSNNEQIIWVGVDRGVYYLLENKVIPDLAVGDFDSVTAEEWEVIAENVPIINRVLPEKDETDMELALIWAVAQQPAEINIFGATGGRLDHFMANAFMIYNFQKPNPSIAIKIIDICNHISVHVPGTYHVEIDEDKKYISFIPLSTEVKALTLLGFKYPLTKQLVEFGSSLCISNELIQQSGTFSFEKGILLMVRSTD